MREPFPRLSSARAVSDVTIITTGEWEHFLYVGKVSFFGWALHYCKEFVHLQRTQ